MAYEIGAGCISCGVCLDECPTSSISETQTGYSIDPETCIDCGKCAEVCPLQIPTIKE